MKVTTLILNMVGEPHFQTEDQIRMDSLFEIANTRKELCSEKGAEWTAGAVSFFGKEVIRAVDTGEYDDVRKAVVEMLMAAWLFDSLYGSVTIEQYMKSDMRFTITGDGIVTHTRILAT